MSPTTPRYFITRRELDAAYTWLCQQRQHFPANADIWDVRRHWSTLGPRLMAWINAGVYRFSPMQQVRKTDGEAIHLWGSQDALVIKCLADALPAHLGLSGRCAHLKGHGGLKATVNRVQRQLPRYAHVFKTDVKDYYASIDQTTLLEQLAEHIHDRVLLNYLWQIIRRVVECGGNYWEVRRGISRGGSISPILGALYLKELDGAMEKHPGYYVRYMDDILVLSRIRWQNRRAVRIVNAAFAGLGLRQHPDKTFIGRIAKGFDFLGYRFGPGPLQLATQTVRKHVERLLRLYEQQAKKKATPLEVARVLGDYVKRWRRWCSAGLGSLVGWTSSYDGTVPVLLSQGP